MKLSEIRMSKRLEKSLHNHIMTSDVQHVLKAMSVLTEVLEHYELNDLACTPSWRFYHKRLKTLDRLCVKLLRTRHPYSYQYD